MLIPNGQRKQCQFYCFVPPCGQISTCRHKVSFTYVLSTFLVRYSYFAFLFYVANFIFTAVKRNVV